MGACVDTSGKATHDLSPYGSMCGDTFWSKKHEVAQQNTHQYRALGLPPYGRMRGRVSREMCEVRLRWGGRWEVGEDAK